MRLYLILAVFFIVIFSCSEEAPVLTKELTVKVVDKTISKALDSAEVQLLSKISDNEFYTDLFYTNSAGICTLSLECNTTIEYRIVAKKEGYISYLEDELVSFDKSVLVIENKEHVLYLTSDSLQNQKYWDSKKERYEMDTLVYHLLPSGKFSELPVLNWKDIDTLMTFRLDTHTVKLKNFPNPLESGAIIKDCYVGTLVLWLIESIRITEKNARIYPIDLCFPINPVIAYIDPDEKFKDGIEAMQNMDSLYLDWWLKVSDLDEAEAAKIDPLKGEAIRWD